MFDFIRTLTPHDSKESMNIFHVRHMVECCTYPLTAIGNAIQKTIANIDEYKEQVRACGDNVDELKKMFMKTGDTTLANWIRNKEGKRLLLSTRARIAEIGIGRSQIPPGLYCQHPLYINP